MSPNGELLQALQIPSGAPTKSGSKWRVGLILLGIITAVIIGAVEAPYILAAGLNGALFGAIGGGIGGALEYLVHQKFTGRFISVGAVLGFIVSHGFDEASQTVGDIFYKHAVEPKVDAIVVTNALVNTPGLTVYKTLREFEPNIFNAMVDDLVTNSRSQSDVVRLMNAVRAKYIQPLLAKNTIYLDDRIVLRYATLLASEMQSFETKKPELCVAGLRGQPLGDIRPYLNAEQSTEELALFEAAIRADKSAPKPVLSTDDQKRLLAGVVSGLSQTYGGDVQLFSPNVDTRGKESVVCRMSVDFFHAISTLDPPYGAQLLRTLIIAGTPH
jgi:hypothetical protein